LPIWRFCKLRYMPSRIIFSTENMEVEVMKNKIKVFRAMHDMTQEELAEKIGVTRQTVIAIESDKYLPSLGLAFKIAKIFKVRIEELFMERSN